MHLKLIGLYLTFTQRMCPKERFYFIGSYRTSITQNCNSLAEYLAQNKICTQTLKGVTDVYIRCCGLALINVDHHGDRPSAHQAGLKPDCSGRGDFNYAAYKFSVTRL